MKHLTDKNGISLTNIQFSIYKVAVWLTNLHLGFQFSLFTAKYTISILFVNKKLSFIDNYLSFNRG